jgi:hypothetical protein
MKSRPVRYGSHVFFGFALSLALLANAPARAVDDTSSNSLNSVDERPLPGSLKLGTFDWRAQDPNAYSKPLALSQAELEEHGLVSSFQVAADSSFQLAADEKKEETAATSAKCLEFRKDINADVGEIIKAGCEPTTAQMSKLMDNPLGNVAMLFTQFDMTKMENQANGASDQKYNYMGIAQFPKRLNKDWNLINRVVWNVPSMPIDQDKLDAAGSTFGSGPEGSSIPPAGSPPALVDLFSGRTTGFGDVYYNGLFSPTKPITLDGGGNILWGAGVDLGIPTATEDLLGTGKWIGGPSALGVYMGPKWKVGALVQHFWDFAGDDDRDDVNLTNLQYFIFYSLDETTSIGVAPNIIANWEQDDDNIFTVPIGIGVAKTVNFGKVPVRIGAELHYSVIQPDDVAGAEWNLRLYFIPAAPSVFFDWMSKPLF